MRLEDYQATKASLAELMNLYDKDGISAVKFRNLIHSFHIMLSYIKHGDDLRIEARIDDLEETLRERAPRIAQ